MGAGLTLRDGAIGPGEQPAADPAAEARLRDLVDTHHDFLWRSLRRLGVPVGDVDDCVQRVFLTAARKLEAIRAGSERSFLFQTALREASDCRRARVRRREDASVEEPADETPVGEDLLDLRRARRVLDGILDSMEMDLRAVFVLCELDELTMAETAVLLGVPPGTVASRLRRARAEFRERAARVAAAQHGGGGT